MKANFTLLALLLPLWTANHSWAADSSEIEVYKSPTCGCCNAWVDHLRENGFQVKTFNTKNMNAVKQHLGVSPQLTSCHTATINGYVIEGHVPATDIKHLLSKNPNVTGLAVPGMPMGSPGMEGPRKDPYSVLTFDAKGNTEIFSQY